MKKTIAWIDEENKIVLFHVIENGKMIKKTESRQEMRQEMCIHPRP